MSEKHGHIQTYTQIHHHGYDDVSAAFSFRAEGHKADCCALIILSDTAYQSLIIITQ